jgi:hypothetical protein
VQPQHDDQGAAGAALDTASGPGSSSSKEIRGTWRARHVVRIDAWSRLPRRLRDAIEAEAASLPLPGVVRPIEVSWST